MIQTCSDQFDKLVAEGKADLSKATFPKFLAIMLGTALNIWARERGQEPMVKIDESDEP